MAAINNKLINITSLNTQGLKSNIDYVSSMLKTNDILFICEHWLSNAEKIILKNISEKTHRLYFTPAEKAPAGRPFGGNCFLIRNQFADDIKIMHEDSNILAIQISSNDLNLIIIGLYLTCYHDNKSVEKYSDQLNTVSALIEMYMDESEVIIIGDYQTFPSVIYDTMERNSPKRNPLSPLLRSFLEENNLELFDVTYGRGPTFTYQHKTLKNQSYLDHVALFKDTNTKIKTCTVYQLDANNMSDHQPVTTTIEIDKTPTLPSIINNDLTRNGNYIPKNAWSKPDFIKIYQNNLANRLNADTINDMTIKSLHNTILESASSAFKETQQMKRKTPFSKSWWTPELSRCKKILSTHFNGWRDEGFPREPNNLSFNRYQLARKNFRKAVKAAQNEIVFTKYMNINSLKKSNPRNFWTNMKKLKETNQKRPFSINNKQSGEEITREFADHFNTLLNIPRINITNAPKPLPDESEESFHIETNDVRAAINSLKVNKASDTIGISAEHIIHAENDNLINLLTDIYNNLFSIGSTPECLSLATLTPLVKSYKKSLKSPNNYRGISLIPILTKVLEYIILQKCPDLSDSHVSQFGFKPNSSTQHAEFIISETIKYYNAKGSNVYLCSLDAEKAFDSCNWAVLFEKLYYEKKIPLPVVKVIKSLYENGTYQVNYNGNISYNFKASQGVFQGSILSPHLYNIYTEELLKDIEKSTTAGTTIYGCYSGITAYADDIILISSTVSGLRNLLNKCTAYFNLTAITLNVEKTQYIKSGRTKSTPFHAHIPLDGYHIQPQSSLKHLGFIWNVKKSGIATMNDENIKERVNKFHAVIYSLIKGGIRYCNPESIAELYRTLAVPTLTYGLELCSLSQRQLNDLDKEGRKALKELFNVSKYSRNYLNKLLGIDHISTTVNNNKLNLMTRLMNHEATKNITLSILSQQQTYISFVHEVYLLADKSGLNFYDIVISPNSKKLKTIHDDIYEDTELRLQNCLKHWNIGANRKEFATILEEHVRQNR